MATSGLGLPAGLTSNPDGTEIRGFVLGDYGPLEPNSVDANGDQNSTYNFFETANTSNITQANITGWVSPLYAISNARDLVVQTVDDGGSLDSVTTGTPLEAFAAGTFRRRRYQPLDAGRSRNRLPFDALTSAQGPLARWTLTAPTPGYYTIYANIPYGNGSVDHRCSLHNHQRHHDRDRNRRPGTTWLPACRRSYLDHGQPDDYRFLVLGKVAGAAANTYVVADALQLREPRQQTIDNTDPPTTAGNDFEVIDGTTDFNVDTNAQDEIGSDYLVANLITRTDTGTDSGPSTTGASFVDWIFPVQTTGSYAISAYYPEPPSTVNTTDATFTPEYYTTDAEYTVKIYPVATAAALTIPELRNQTVNTASTDGTAGPSYIQTAIVDQSRNGGQYRQVFSQAQHPGGLHRRFAAR